MRLLMVHPGASFSTHDVYVGLLNALIDQGHQVYSYQLDSRIERAGSWLKYCWRKAGKPDPKPTSADVLYRASVEALERALRFHVDGVLVVSAMYFHPDVLTLMRRAGLRIGVVFTESPYDDEKQLVVAPLADVCWTNERTSVEPLRFVNKNTHYLPHAYNPEIHKPSAPSEEVPAHDVVFVGTAFQERVELLSAVDWTGIDLGIYGAWQTLPSRSRLRQYVRGSVVDNAYAVQLYQRAKIGLNLYRQSVGFGRNAPRITHAESMNPRAYELAACGVFQLADHRAEHAETFQWTAPAFTTPQDLEKKIRAFLDRPYEREHKAESSRQRIGPHTYAARAAQLMAQLQSDWAEPLAKGA